jgi:hypothetical protein
MKKRMFTTSNGQLPAADHRPMIALTPRRARPELFGACQVRRRRPYAAA